MTPAITQADRDAAAALANEICGCADRNQHRRDVELAMQFREAALLEGMLIERERMVKWLRDQSAGSTHEWAKSAAAYADIIEHYEHECDNYNLPPAK